MEKKCSKCELILDVSKFTKHSKSKDGYYFCCKSCKSDDAKRYYDKHSEYVKNKSNNYYNSNKEEAIKCQKNYYESNRDSLLEYKKEYHLKNKDRQKELNSIYQNTHKSEIGEAKRIYISKRRKDPLFKLKESISKLINYSIKNGGYSKKYRSEEILGCKISDFKLFIEKKFKDGMTWSNYGEWHLDHIRPVSWANSESEIIELNHFSNFQPLWENENLSKGNRWEG